MKSKIQTHRDLLVYQRAFENAMQLYALSEEFPREEVVFPYRSDAAVFAVGLRKLGRGVAQKTVSGGICQQA